jgi:hypothetical protein
MDLDSFINEVNADFVANREYYTDLVRGLIPEVQIIALEITGSYSFDSSKRPTEESDIDLKIIYSGDLSEEEVAERLYGEIYGVGGTFDIIPFKVEKNPKKCFYCRGYIL